MRYTGLALQTDFIGNFFAKGDGAIAAAKA
jgi:hypothetical protein